MERVAEVSANHLVAPDAEKVVGREVELDVIDRVLAGLAGGVGGVVAISGEPGIGKSLILSELLRRAEGRGLTVLDGRGTQFERDVPFGLVVDALDRPLARVGSKQLAGLGTERLVELGSILPSLADYGGPLLSRLQVERHRAHHALRAALEELAAPLPLVLGLDDVHWADEASVEFVCYLLRHWPQHPLLLVLCYRPEATPRLLSENVAAAGREGVATELKLGPLTESEADGLLTGELDPALREALYGQSGGNPFYLRELARAVARGAHATARGATGDTALDQYVPRTVMAAIREELANLSPEGDQLVRAAAVAGEPFDFDVAAEIAELDADKASSALDELLACGLFREMAVPFSYRFRHPIVRQAVYETAGEGWRIRAHGRAATVLERRRANVMARAHHVERSARWGDERAIQVLVEAAEAAAARAPAAAAAWLQAAIRILPAHAPDQRRVALLGGLARALEVSGRISEAREALVEALSLVPDERAVDRAQLVGAIARLDHMLGRYGQARALLTDTLALIADRSPVGTTALRLELAIDFWLASDRDRMHAVAQSALNEADPRTEPALAAAATAITALAACYRGEMVEAQRLIALAREQVDALSDDVLSARIEALMCLGHTEFAMDQDAAASAHLERGIRIARATGQNSWFLLLMCLFGVSELWQGRLESAERAGNTAVESALLIGGEPLIWARTLQCWVATLRGDIRDAIRIGEQAVGLAGQPGRFIFGWLAHFCLGAALLEAGDADRAAAEIIGHTGGESLAAVERSSHARVCEVMAAVALKQRDVTSAETWVCRAEEVAAELALDGRIGEARRARAALNLARGDAAAAATAARDAVGRFTAIGRVVDAGRAEVLLGRSLAALGDSDSAEDAFERGYRTLAACGAQRAADAAAHELRQLGRRVPRARTKRRTPTDERALTKREQEVAELVAHGRTNRQIADELFLSPKTVESHLARIFEKLAVSSRAGVAAAVERARQ